MPRLEAVKIFMIGTYTDTFVLHTKHFETRTIESILITIKYLIVIRSWVMARKVVGSRSAPLFWRFQTHAHKKEVI